MLLTVTMNTLTITVFCVIAIIATLTTSFLYSKGKDKIPLMILSKALTSTLFVIVGLFVIISRQGEILDSILLGISLGLICGLLGDILLSLHPLLNEKNALTMNGAGMLAFTLGHIMYFWIGIIVASFSWLTVFGYIVLPILIIVLHSNKIISLKELFVPVLCYCLVINAMLVQSIYVHFLVNNTFTMLYLFASILFVISDFVLLLNNYATRKFKYAISICLIIYYTAQFTFSFSILLLS